MEPGLIAVIAVLILLVPLVIWAISKKSPIGVVQSPASVDEEIAELEAWRFRMAGGTFASRVGNVDRNSIYRHLEDGQQISVVREPENHFDFNCISFWLTISGQPDLDIGFVPKKTAAVLAPLIDRGADFSWSFSAKRFGQRGQFVHITCEAKMTKPPRLKHRPKREAILRKRKEEQLDSMLAESCRTGVSE